MIYIFSLCTQVYAVNSFVTFIEYTEEERVIPLVSNLFRYDVDINSYIEVRLHPEELVNLSQLRTPISEKLQKEVTDLSNLLSTSRDHLKNYVQDINDIYAQLQKNPTPALEEEFRQQVAAHGELIDNIILVLEPVFGIKKLDEALSRPDPLYTDLFDLLAVYLKDVHERLNNESQRLIKESGMIVNLWCIHHSKNHQPVAIHLNHYDRLEAGTIQMIDKFAMSSEDQQQLRESLKMHENLRKVVSALQEQKGDISLLWNELNKQFLVDLEKLKDGICLNDIEELLKDLEKEVASDTSLQMRKINQSIQDLSATYQQFTELQKQYDELMQVTKDEKNTDLGIIDIIDSLNTFQKQLVSVMNSHVAEQTLDLVKNVEKYLIDAELPSEVEEKINDLIQRVQKWYLDFDKMKEQFEKNNFFSAYSVGMMNLASRLGYVSTFENLSFDTDIPAEINQVSLADAKSTIIDIPRTLRQEGDTYTFYVQIRKGDNVLLYEEYIFRVKNYGLNTVWNSNLIFVKGGGQKSYQPSTGVSCIVHYQPRPHEGRSLIFVDNVLKPGVGLSATMFYTNDRIEYGLGVTVTFFNDFVQVGYGLNFQRSSREGNGYFFIGTSMFDIFEQKK